MKHTVFYNKYIVIKIMIKKIVGKTDLAQHYHKDPGHCLILPPQTHTLQAALGSRAPLGHGNDPLSRTPAAEARHRLHGQGIQVERTGANLSPSPGELSLPPSTPRNS